MKRLIYILLLSPLFALAQPPLQGDYEVITPEDKLLSSYGKKLPGYYMGKDGNKVDCLILFEEGDKINNPDVKLTTSLSHAGERVMVDKSTIKAFFVNNKLYVPTSVIGVERWVSLETQGAIRVVHDAKFSEKKVNKKLEFWYDKEKGTNVGYWDTLGIIMPYWAEAEYIQKLNNEPEAILMLNRKNMLKLVGDYQELATKIDNKEKGYKNSLIDLDYKERMFGIYNKWYDEQNSGVITYYEARATFVAPDKPIVIAAASTAVAITEEAAPSSAASDYQEKVVSAAEEAHRAPRIDVFAGRPATAGAAVASAKPEVTVKKESFKDRLARIKADGNKVGVLVTSKNLVINPYDFGEGVTKARVLGSYGPLTDLDKLATATVNELNAAFGIDVFEAVDYSQIPYKEAKYGKIDDWWATKYKVIIMYELLPYYLSYYAASSADPAVRSYYARMKIDSDMIMMAAEDAKPEKLKWVTSSPKTWGIYRSDKKELPPETDLMIIQELKGTIDPPSDAALMDELIKSQKVLMAKFIKKKSK